MQRLEEAAHGERHVDLDASHKDQVPTSKSRVHNVEHLGLDGVVGLHDQVLHRVDGLVDFVAMRLQLLAQPTLHHVLRVCWHPLAGTQLAICSYDRPTRSRQCRLPLAEELPQLAGRGDADVGTEDNEDVAAIRNVVGEGPKASLAYVGRSADAAKVEGLAVVPGQERREVPPVAVDLVRAEGLAVDRVAPVQAVRLDGLQDDVHDLRALERAGEVLPGNLRHLSPLRTQERNLMLRPSLLDHAWAGEPSHQSQRGQRCGWDRQAAQEPAAASGGPLQVAVLLPGHEQPSANRPG
mmetsp:Transcript_17283/g.46909  ORF Transcript_17283/g.46909 Transcript_17283/m.46909 type:complete len:295 (+) Transcript_17283:194-1078(+)